MKRRIITNVKATSRNSKAGLRLRSASIRKPSQTKVPLYLMVLATARKHGVPSTLSPAEVYNKTGVSKATALKFERQRLFSQPKTALSKKQLEALANKTVNEAYKQKIPNAVDRMLGKKRAVI